MSTNLERVADLHALLGQLSVEITERGLGDEVANMAEQLRSDPGQLDAVTDQQWKVMLPAERKRHLAGYFLTRRAELLELDTQREKEFERGHSLRWKYSRAAKLIELGAAVATLAELAAAHGWEALRFFGLGAGGSREAQGVSLVVADAQSSVQEALRLRLYEAGSFAAETGIDEAYTAAMAADASTLARMAAEIGLLDHDDIKLFIELRDLRNLATSGADLNLTEEKVMEYLDRADAMVVALENKPPGTH